MSLPRISLALSTVLVLAGSTRAQIPAAQLTGPAVDPGVPVGMFESANLDRALRKAQDFLGSQEYDLAIKVLQDVIEGRASEFLDPAEEKKRKAAAKKAEAGRNPRDRNARDRNARQPEPADALPVDEDNPAYSVFSSDQKIYRPVSRLCHELLASMSPEGIGLYRVKYEAVAGKLYEEATATGELSKFDTVYTNYFVTLHAARAMEHAADLLMDAGRFRAAIQTLNTLLDVYPDDSRREAGIHDLMLMVKLAICFQQLGEFELAREQLAATTRVFPEDSVRLMGELRTVKDLHQSELFDAGNVAVPVRPRVASTLDLTATEPLIPLWEYRFKEPKPYSSAGRTTQNQSRFPMVAGQAMTGSLFPRITKYVPGTTVRFEDDSLVFLDCYRPVVHEIRTGRQSMAMGAPELAVLRMRASASSALPRARTPAYDYFQNRVAADAERYYSIVGYDRVVSGQTSFKAIHDNILVAHDRKTGTEVWRLNSREDYRKRPITFLAAPTVYRRMLLMPFLEGGSYGLLGVGCEDGKEVYRTYLHYRGTGLARAPAAPVLVDSGVAYVLTNAGVLGSVDANTGVLNWSRKYERVHPQRGSRTRARTRGNNAIRRYVQPQPTSFSGFSPTDLILVDGLIILAAIDSSVLLCVNGASGDVMWLHNAGKPRMHDHQLLVDRLWGIVGHNGVHLFATCGESGNQLLCIDIKTGVRLWAATVPGSDTGEYAGRGFVTDGFVVLPGRPNSRQLHVIDARSRTLPSFRTLDLPAFSIGKEPLGGPANLFVHGAYLALGYESGIELFSSSEALALLARQSASPRERASFLVQAGLFDDAAAILFTELDRTDLQPEERDHLSIRTLSLAEDISVRHAKEGRGPQALAILDQCAKRVKTPHLVRRIHLFRLQVYRELGDLAGIEREQEFIESGAIK